MCPIVEFCGEHLNAFNFYYRYCVIFIARIIVADFRKFNYSYPDLALLVLSLCIRKNIKAGGLGQCSGSGFRGLLNPDSESGS